MVRGPGGAECPTRSPFSFAPRPTGLLKGVPAHVSPTVKPDGAPVAHAGQGVSVCVASDLGPDGHTGRCWLVVADGEVRVLSAPGAWPPEGPPHAPAAEHLDGGRLLLAPPPDPGQVDPEPVLRLPLATVKGASVEPLVAAGALVASTTSGPRTLLRFSSALAADFGLAARAIEALASGEPVALDPRDLPRYCPTCGRRLPANTRVCSVCVDRGAVLRRLLAFAKPYRWRLGLAACLMVLGTALGVLPPKIMQWITDGLL